VMGADGDHSGRNEIGARKRRSQTATARSATLIATSLQADRLPSVASSLPSASCGRSVEPRVEPDGRGAYILWAVS